MYELYYLADQKGPIDGEKTYQGVFEIFEDAKNKAENENVVHFSVEYVTEDLNEIVFIV